MDPIVLCAWCGRRKLDPGPPEVWSTTPDRTDQVTKAQEEGKISHGICPDCKNKALADFGTIRP